MIIRIFISIIVILFITSCSLGGKPPPEKVSPKKLDPDAGQSNKNFISRSRPKGQIYKVQAGKPLELPPDLIATANENVKQSIDSYTPDQDRVLPTAMRARIIKDGDTRWLEIDTDVEAAWKAMTEFWSLSGITLVNFNPEAGLMETDWIEDAQVPDQGESRLKQMAQQIVTSISRSNTALDKYRLRFERLSENQTAMHVSHRWTARKEIYKIKKISEFAWVELPSDPSRVAEFLQNIVLLFEPPTSP